MSFWKKILFNLIRKSTVRQNGQALVYAMILTIVVAGITTYILDQVNQAQKDTRRPRIQSELNKLEAKFRADLTHVSSFDCSLALAYSPPDYRLCTLPATFYNTMSRTVRGCVPPPAGGFCGVQIVPRTAPTYGPVTNTLDLTADIIYTGTELSMAARVLDVKVPIEILNSTPFQGTCPSSRPIFKGFDKSGTIRCDLLPYDCPAGSFLEVVQPGQRATSLYKCTGYDTTISCPAGQVLSNFSWNGGTAYTATCSPVADIFSYFGTPAPTIGPALACATCGTSVIIPATTTTTAATTTTTTTTTIPTTTTTGSGPTTTIPTTTTTMVACSPNGFQTGLWSGSSTDFCTAQSSYGPGFGPDPNPTCCSGIHSAAYGPADMIGGGMCYWKCGP